MNVEKVRQQIHNPANTQKKRSLAPKFTSNRFNQVESLTSSFNMGNEVKLLMPKSVKTMKRLSDSMGEVQNIIVNAIGTALVAPVFIKWNPFSKTDEDTRTYSAWRQPVSALITILTQVGIAIPFDRMIENRANRGFYDERYNKTLFQDEKFIEKQIKCLYPNISKDRLEQQRDEKVADQKATLKRMIRENKIVMSTSAGKTHKYSDEAFTNLLNKVLDDKLNSEQTELKRSNEERIPRKIKRKEYYRTHNEEARNIFTKINEMLDTKSPDAVKKYVKGLKKNADKNSELSRIYQDILERRGNSDKELKIALKDKLAKILEDIDKFTETKYPTSKSLADHIKQVETEKRINPIKESIEALENMKKQVAKKQTVAAIETELENIVRDKETHRLFKFNFSDEVAKLLKNQVKNSIKGHKQIVQMIVSFLTLPISCTALNWCYPRFMDAVFPNLSNKKHPKEIKDLTEKANKQMEVK